jgi:hypothetical protein
MSSSTTKIEGIAACGLTIVFAKPQAVARSKA